MLQLALRDERKDSLLPKTNKYDRRSLPFKPPSFKNPKEEARRKEIPGTSDLLFQTLDESSTPNSLPKRRCSSQSRAVGTAEGVERSFEIVLHRSYPF